MEWSKEPKSCRVKSYRLLYSLQITYKTTTASIVFHPCSGTFLFHQTFIFKSYSSLLIQYFVLIHWINGSQVINLDLEFSNRETTQLNIVSRNQETGEAAREGFQTQGCLWGLVWGSTGGDLRWAIVGGLSESESDQPEPEPNTQESHLIHSCGRPKVNIHQSQVLPQSYKS